jgi:hypothetical protein
MQELKSKYDTTDEDVFFANYLFAGYRAKKRINGKKVLTHQASFAK